MDEFLELVGTAALWIGFLWIASRIFGRKLNGADKAERRAEYAKAKEEYDRYQPPVHEPLIRWPKKK